MISQGKCYLVAEIGINHNGIVDQAIAMVQAARKAGADAVKFQKRTIDVVYTAQELQNPRQSVYGTTNGDLKRGLEFCADDYAKIDEACREVGIDWYASPWDEEAADFIAKFPVPYLKIASASVTDRQLLTHCAGLGKPLLVSTGMCDLPMVEKAMDVIAQAGGTVACLYHCVASYPTAIEDINLAGIKTLQDHFPGTPIGYSGHETGTVASLSAAAMGAASIERHVTLDRKDWGSDQAASLEMSEFSELADAIRLFEKSRGDGVKRICKNEEPVAAKLRRKNTL